MSQLATGVLEAWAVDPGLFWRDLAPRHPLREDQERVLLSAVKPDARTAFRGPRGWGKSTTLAAAGLHWMATRPRSLAFAITPSERQTRSLFTEVAALYYGSDLRRLYPDWRVGIMSAETPDPSQRFVGASSDSPLLLEGLHGEHVMLLIDEGRSLEDSYFNSAMGTLAGARSTSVLATGTAGGRGWFFRCWGVDRQRWETFIFTPENSPHVAAMVEQERQRLGERDPFFRREYLSEFAPDQDSQALFELAAVERCIGLDPYAQIDALWPTAKTRSIGCDPARSGDRTMLSFWHGRRLERLAELPHADLMTQSGQIVNAVRAYRARTLGVDSTGLGLGLLDRLAEIFDGETHNDPRDVVTVTAFVSGATASPSGRERFANLKTETCWRLKMLIEEQRIGFPASVAEVLIPDLLGERLEVRSDGRMKACDPPSRSPDALDAVLVGLFASAEGAMPGTACLDFNTAAERGLL